MYNRNVVGHGAARNCRLDGLQCSSSMASLGVNKNDGYLNAIIKNIYFRVDLVILAVNGFQSSPHRPGKTRQ